MIDFEAFKHPILAVPCPDCQQPAGSMCKRPSGHGAMDAHKSRKEAADAAFIQQYGEAAWIERLPPGNRWKVHKEPYRTELTSSGEQSVIPGCERDASPKARQLDLF